MREMKNSGIEWIGEIPESWQKNKIVRTFKIIGSGTTPKSYNEDYYSGDIHWIQSGDINGGYLCDTKSFVSRETVNEYSALKIYSAPFIIIAMYGASIGNISISNIDGCVNQACCVLEECLQNFRFLYYVLYISKEYLIQKSKGGGQPNISQEIIKQLWIPVPPLPEQRRIADFLDRKCAEIDAVIEKTKAAVEEYKKLKQSVITEAVTKGVRGPRPMKPSGVEWIGDVPEGWEKSKIKYISYFSPTCATDDLTPESEVTYTPMECIHNGYFDNQKSTFSKFSNSYTLYQEGDIVLAKVTPCFENGNISVMTNLYSNIGFGSSELFVLRPNGIETKYLFYYLQNDIFKKMACSTMTGTGGLKRVSPAFIENYFIPIPDKSEQQEISDYLDRKCAGIDNILAKKQQFIKELETYKKSLIYEYVTGKKEVK